MKRDLISILELSPDEVERIIELTEKLKTNRTLHQDILSGKTIALVFQKPSNRTRVSFEVGINELGGNCLYLGPQEIKLGIRETTSDVAQTLSRYLGGIVARTNSHKDVVELAKYSSVPVINGLSDLYHPCQALTDIFSVKEKFGAIRGLTLTYVGDGNNVCRSLLLTCTKIGMNISIATPKGYEPDALTVKKAESYAKASGSKVFLTNDPRKAVKNTNVIYTDVWVSMGQEEQAECRMNDFKSFQINKSLVSLADKNFIFMHCLPAHRGIEVTEEVIDGKHSIIFDQAENRLHTQKAILVYLLTNSL